MLEALRSQIRAQNILRMSQETGLTRKTLHDFANGKPIRSDTLEKVMSYLSYEIAPSKLFRASFRQLKIDPDRAKAFEKLIQEIILLMKPERIVLFGSQARGDWDEDSDFDIAVFNTAERGRLLAVRKAARAKNLKIRFDIIPIDESDPRSRFSPVTEQIEKEGVLVYQDRSRQIVKAGPSLQPLKAL